MRTFSLIIAFVFFVSCSSSYKTKSIKFKFYEEMKKHRLSMKIPQGYNLIIINTGGEGSENRYWYSDSSLIYISDAKGVGTMNEILMQNQPDLYKNHFLSDSIIFIGKNTNGNYWKEVKYKGLLYGYYNVPPDKKERFDSAILSGKYK